MKKKKKRPVGLVKTVLKNFRATAKTLQMLKDKAKTYTRGNESKFLRLAIHNYVPKKKRKL